jgi:ATP-binding cassette, subfamily B, bacterial PglK
MNFFKNIVRPTLRLLPRESKRKGVWLVFLLLSQTILDILSVASFFPLAVTIVQPALLENNYWVKTLFQTLPYFTSANLKFFLIGFILLFFILKHLAGVYITYFRTKYAFDVAGHISKGLMQEYMQQSYSSFYQQKTSGQLINIVHIPAAFAQNILLALTTLCIEFTVLIGIAFLMISYDWRAFIFMSLISFMAIVFYQSIKNRLSTIGSQQKVSYPKLIERILSAFDSFIEINIYQKGKAVIHDMSDLTDRLNELQVQQATHYANSMRFFETTAALGLCLLIGYLVLVSASVESAVFLIGIYSACGFRAIPSFNRIMVATFQIKTNEYVIDEIGSKLNSTVAMVSPAKMPVSFIASFDLHHISFQYPERPVLFDNLNLTIKKGEKIVLSGTSGSGKSSLLLLLMGFLQPQEGEINIDSDPLSSEQLISWQERLSYVPQSPILFDGSIAENVAFEDSVDAINVKKIERLLVALGLQVWLQQLPNGLNTSLGEKGVQISGGQRHRLAIARALYMDREVILLDEVTSNLDDRASHDLIQVITKLPQTVIMITHDETLFPYFDKAFRLENKVLKELL